MRTRINPFNLRTAQSERPSEPERPVRQHYPFLRTQEYDQLDRLCQRAVHQPSGGGFNIVITGQYGTGKTKYALDLMKEWSHEMTGLYIEISGRSCGQLINNIYRSVHDQLFGSSRLIFEKDSGGIGRGIGAIFGSKRTFKTKEGIAYVIPEDHILTFLEKTSAKESADPGEDSEKKPRKPTKKQMEAASDKVVRVRTEFEEAFAGIIEYREVLDQFIEEVIPEQISSGLTDPERAAFRLHRVFDVIGAPVIFVLDELEKIFRLPRDEAGLFLDFLRALLDRNTNNIVILCFTKFSFERIVKQHAALYHRIPYIIDLKNMNEMDFHAFLDERWEAANSEPIGHVFEGSFINLVSEATGRNPRAALLVMDRFVEHAFDNGLIPLEIAEDGAIPPVREHHLLSFLLNEWDITGQLLDVLLFDHKERAAGDQSRSIVLDILVHEFGGGPASLIELSASERCPYEVRALQDILLKMVESDVLAASGSGSAAQYVVNAYIPRVLIPRWGRGRLSSMRQGVVAMVNQMSNGEFDGARKILKSKNTNAYIDVLEALSALGADKKASQFLARLTRRSNRGVAELAQAYVKKQSLP